MTIREFISISIVGSISGAVGTILGVASRNGLPIKLDEGTGTASNPFTPRLAVGPKDSIYSATLYARQQLLTRVDLTKLFPEVGYCYRCKFPWVIVTSHITNYTSGRGCFCLCEECWHDLQTGDNRLPYYVELIEKWGPQRAVEGNQIRAAVAGGK